MDMGLMQCAIRGRQGKDDSADRAARACAGAGVQVRLLPVPQNAAFGRECAALEQLGIPVERAQTDNTKFVFEMNAAERVRISWRSGAVYPRGARCALR